MTIRTRLHSTLTGDDVGTIVWKDVADSVARLAIAVDAGDVGRIVKQLDDNSHWILAALPSDWINITQGAGAGGATNTVTGQNGVTNTGNNVNAVLEPVYGSAANTVAQGDDSRLSDARTPTAHAASHNAGGTDELQAQLLGSGAGPVGQIAQTDGAGGWTLITTPTGGVTGPGSAVDEALARFDTTTGNLIQSSLVTLSDAGTLTGVVDLRFALTAGAHIISPLPGTGVAGDQLFIQGGGTTSFVGGPVTVRGGSGGLVAHGSVAIGDASTETVEIGGPGTTLAGGPTDLRLRGAVSIGEGSALQSGVNVARVATLVDRTGPVPDGPLLLVDASPDGNVTAGLGALALQTSGTAALWQNTDGATAWTAVAVTLATAAPADVTKAAAVVGTSIKAAREDHKHDVSTATAGAISIGDTAAEGSASSIARSDHTHGLAAPAAPAAVTKAVAAAGASTAAARADHKHDVSTAAPIGTGVQVGGTAAEGSATTLARSDHSHTVTAGIPVDVTKAANAAGAAATFARSDHKHDVSTATAGAITVGATAAEGSASSLARSDHTHSLAAPAAPANVTKAAANAGASSAPARADHKHDVDTAAPVAIGTANAEGAATTLARSNHVHAHGNQTSATLHAAATSGANGFMPATDKVKLDALPTLATANWKQSVRIATVTAGTLASSFANGSTVDGVVLATGNRILIKNQAAGAENGIYTVNASGAPTRATDMPAASSAAGAVTVSQEGNANQDKPWLCTTNEGSAVVGTNILAFGSLQGATSFLALTDTPGSYAGESLKGVRVNAGETALEFATISGGASFSPSQFGVWTQVADGTAANSVTSGQFCVGVGSSGTPSGITRFHVNATNLATRDMGGLITQFGVGNHIIIYDDATAANWWIYSIVPGTKNTAGSGTSRVNVTHVGDSGATFSVSSNYRFTVFTGNSPAFTTQTNFHEFQLGANLNQWTYADAGGWSSYAITKDLGSAASPETLVGNRWPGLLMNQDALLSQISLIGEALNGTPSPAITATLSGIKSARTLFSLTTTNTLMGTATVYAGFGSLGEWTSANINTGGISVLSGDVIGVAIKRNSASTFTTYRGSLVYEYYVLNSA